MPPITSKSNPKIKEVRALKERKARAESGLFVVEGIRHVAEALEAGAPVEYLVYCPELLNSPFGRELVDKQRARRLPMHSVTAQVDAMLSERENPTGLLAGGRRPRRTRAELNPANQGWGAAAGRAPVARRPGPTLGPTPAARRTLPPLRRHRRT